MILLAGGLGFEPRQAESESAVLPLDDPPRPGGQSPKGLPRRAVYQVASNIASRAQRWVAGAGSRCRRSCRRSCRQEVQSGEHAVGHRAGAGSRCRRSCRQGRCRQEVQSGELAGGHRAGAGCRAGRRCSQKSMHLGNWQVQAVEHVGEAVRSAGCRRKWYSRQGRDVVQGRAVEQGSRARQ